ncbi:PREDICTED: cadherin-23-like [Branchiostoma belcheri]|uniref:Cadherin-23-like n=1 Tax=Branchiostoma belcheri TaxID=7741 RepID=A0A6P5AV56_BRABE|nr:PREDICTED: cadherin-23-like [Branchiostoma belcheri]
MYLVGIVQDVNEAPTLNLNSVVTIAENSTVGTSVFNVNCADQDTTSPNGDTVLTHTDTGNSGFFDVASTGEVTLSSSTDLNYETKQLHTITFTCTDGGTPALSATGTLDVQVTNVNEPPVITNPSAGSEIKSIDENTSPNTNVYQFVASDEDSGDTMTWTIDSQTPNTQFVLDGATGQVSTVSSPVLDFETNNQYILVVHVADSASPSLTASASLTVNLNDLNEAPTFTVFPPSDTLDVDENESGSAVLFTYTVSDEESGSLTFTMDTNPSGGTAPFEFVKTSATTADIRTVAAPNIDFETVNQYDLTLTVTDDGSGNLSEDRSLTIYVQDINEAPVINNTASSLTMTLDENQAANTAVFTFTGNDEDQPGDTLTWKITSQSPSSQFDINAATGVISTSSASVINFESAETQYVLDVTLDDGTGANTFTATATLTINVQDVNETPDFTSFPGSASVDVNENTTGSVTVQSFTVYDDDNALVSTTQDITYTIALVSPAGATLPFTFDKVDNTNVDLNTDSTAAIDYETMWSTYSTNQYEVTLTVSDGTISTPRTFYINIIDVNEAPVITNLASSLSITIDEDESGGKNLIFFTGTDEDLPGDTLTWSIASQTPSALGTNFEIGPSTGTLSVVSSPNLDYEQETQYLLQVELSDGTGAGRLTATATYTVNIRDINEAPSFSDTSLTYEVDENSAGGVAVCPTSNTACTTTLQGTDPDGDTLTYSLISYSPVEDGYSNPFQLTQSGNDLVLETVASPELDYERATAYTLKIRVKDGSTSGSKSSTGEITINLVDLDESPEWRNLPNSVTVSEDMAGNQKVYTLDAVDPEGVAVTYALNTVTTAFQLVAGTGEIRTTTTPNLESGAFLYTLEIEAVDASFNTATSTLTVNVAFYDDSPPVFSPTTYNVNVNEGESLGTTVTTIAATDADVGDVVQYYITGGNGYFQVDSSGVITTGTELDRDAVGSPASYTLTLTAYDTSGLSAQATVTVNVDAVNDNAPIFSQTVTSVDVTENTATTTSVLQLTCTDADTGTDGDLVYAIDSGNTDGLFGLDTSTGLITVAIAIDMEAAAIISANFRYTLKVTAVDQAAVAADRLTSTATIYVTITGQNEFTANFTTMPASDTVTLSEDTAVATTVTSGVAATDGDQGSQGDIVYAITGGDTSTPRTFTMNPDTGRIVLAQPLDFETTPVYFLELSAIDDGSPALTGTTTLTVSVTDVDDASPTFSAETYEATVREDETAML